MDIFFIVLEEGFIIDIYYVKLIDFFYFMGSGIGIICLELFLNEVMFREIEEKLEDIYNIDFEYGDVLKYLIVICYCLVWEDVYIIEDGKDVGRMVFGKYVNRNKGVFLIRVEWELLIDDDWCNDLRDWWWGIEVLFYLCYDELFGVGKDK